VGIAVFSNRTYCSAGEANQTAMVHLLRDKLITSTPRSNDTLSIRSFQLLDCISKSFDDKISNEIFSLNFFLDKPKRLWIKDTEGIRDILANISTVSRVIPENDLRGTFEVTGTNGKKVKVYFTMTPENPPRIQTLKLNIK